MKLFLTSSTITPNLIKPFEELADRSVTGIKAVFIPDAGFAPGIEDKKWIEDEYLELINNLGWKVDIFSLHDKSEEELNILFNYDVIYVNGGFSGFLAKAMRKCGFDKKLPALLKSNIIYVGSSGGSMVMSDVQDAASWYIGESEPEAIDIPGLSYINFQIYPHYEDSLLKEIMQKINPQLKYALLRDGEAVAIEDQSLTYLGDSIAIIDAGVLSYTE